MLFSKLAAQMGWQHNSPSMVISGAIHMSDYFPDLKNLGVEGPLQPELPWGPRFGAADLGMFMSVFAKRIGQVVLVWGLALLFMMPRLVAGAHWGQDDYIGGVLLALLALGWGYYTPFAAKVSGWLLRVIEPVFGLLQQVPVINRLSVIRNA